MQEILFPLLEVTINLNGSVHCRSIGNWDNAEESGILWSVAIPDDEDTISVARYAAACTLFGLCKTWEQVLEFKPIFDERRENAWRSEDAPF